MCARTPILGNPLRLACNTNFNELSKGHMTLIPTKTLYFIGFVNALLLSSLSEAATIGVCSPDLALQPQVIVKEFYAEDGQRQLLVTSDEPLDVSLCESITIPQSTDSILWSALLPSSQSLTPQNRLILQGSFSESRAQVSEVIGAEPAAEPVVPSNQVENQLTNFDSLTFGVEERAHWIDGTQLNCSAGSQVAGVQLESPEHWPANSQLQIVVSGDGDFQLAIADEKRIANEATLSIGHLLVAGGTRVVNRTFQLPDNDASWKALTITCPQETATLRINALVLKPSSESPTRSSRSAWVWNPSFWLNSPDFFWTLAELEGLDEFYITAPTTAVGEVQNPHELRAFIREANSRDITIWAVIGDRHDVIAGNFSELQTRILAYLRYNAWVPNVEKLAGVQLDIEPYLLPGFGLAHDYWRERYLQTITLARRTAGQALPLDLVLPVWWGSHASWGSKLLDELTLPNISLTIMNYRTNYQQLLTGMTPFLEWGNRNQQAVRVALETGTLEDETQRVFEKSTDAGELWQLQIGSTPILVLFSDAQENLAGDAYQQTAERLFSASSLTFGGNQQRLNENAYRLNEELSSWSSFIGVALHGLDEIYRDQQ